jgi:hypothetical protein
MGYGERATKKSIIRMARLHLGEESVLAFMKMYQNLNELPLSLEDRSRCITETCANGWQYLIHFVKRNELLTVPRGQCALKVEF